MTNRVIRTKQFDSQISTGSLRGLLLLVGLIALLGFIYLGQNGQATMTGRRAQDLQERLDRIKRENAQLEVEIAQLTLPSRIADRARIIGFHPATITQTVFVVVKNYPVEVKPGAAPTATAATVSSSFDFVTVWNGVLNWVGLAPAAQTVEATGP
jgi:cell division protein FtsL